MVPPRYGSEVVGGAENLMGALARRAAEAGMDVEVATTCATNIGAWVDDLPAGETLEGGVLVHRFPTTPRDGQRHVQLMQQLNASGRLSALDEVDLLGTSQWSEDLQRFIDAEGPGYDWIIFTPYLFGTTFWGAQSWPERTAVIPCLHDEPIAHVPSVQRMLRQVALLLFNAPGEQRLAARLLHQAPGAIVGMGFDLPAQPADTAFADRHGLGRYVLYAGRLEEGKRVDVAAAYVAEYAKRTRDDVTLVMIGDGSWQPPAEVQDHVRVLGFVSPDEKRAAMAGACALINPSQLESLSIVMLEAWLEGTPALVAGESEVMTDHCRISGGGLTFTDQRSFDEALGNLLRDHQAARAMGMRGRDYVTSEYSWERVLQRFDEALASAPHGN